MVNSVIIDVFLAKSLLIIFQGIISDGQNHLDKNEYALKENLASRISKTSSNGEQYGTIIKRESKCHLVVI